MHVDFTAGDIRLVINMSRSGALPSYTGTATVVISTLLLGFVYFCTSKIIYPITSIKNWGKPAPSPALIVRALRVGQQLVHYVIPALGYVKCQAFDLLHAVSTFNHMLLGIQLTDGTGD